MRAILSVSKSVTSDSRSGEGWQLSAERRGCGGNGLFQVA
jgi:hypothetical protein